MNNQKNHEMKTSVKIMKLTNQMISKSYNSYININLTIRRFQRDKNYQISPYILRVIAPASQLPIRIENEQTLVKRQIERSNIDEILRIRYPQKADETRNPMKPKSNDLDLRSWRNQYLKIRKIL